MMESKEEKEGVENSFYGIIIFCRSNIFEKTVFIVFLYPFDGALELDFSAEDDRGIQCWLYVTCCDRPDCFALLITDVSALTGQFKGDIRRSKRFKLNNLYRKLVHPKSKSSSWILLGQKQH